MQNTYLAVSHFLDYVRSDGGATDTDVDTGRRIQTFDVGSADVNRARELASLRPDDERTLESIAHVFAAERDDLATGFVEAVREHPAADALDRDELDGSLEREQRELLEELPTASATRRFRPSDLGDETATLLAAGPDAYLGSREVYYEGILRAIADDVKAEYAPETDLEPVEDERTDGGAVTTNADSPNGVSDAVDAVVDRALAFVRVANVDEQLAMRAYASARDDEVEAYEAKLERQQSKLDDYERQIEEYEAKLERTEDSRKPSKPRRSASNRRSTRFDRCRTTSHGGRRGSTIWQTNRRVDKRDRRRDLRPLGDRRGDRFQRRGGKRHQRTRRGTHRRHHRHRPGGDRKMERVEDAADDVTDDVEALREGVQRIDEIVEVINDIADQTNLLALNASIEAATAGRRRLRRRRKRGQIARRGPKTKPPPSRRWSNRSRRTPRKPSTASRPQTRRSQTASPSSKKPSRT